MNNPRYNPPYIKQQRGYYGFYALVVVTIAFYAPYFYGKWAKKINAMAKCVLGESYRKVSFSPKAWTVGWCAFLSPAIFLFAKGFLFNAAQWRAILSWDMALSDALFEQDFRWFIGAIQSTPYNGLLFAGAWALVLLIMAAYCVHAVNEIKARLLDIAKQYADEGLITREGLKFYQKDDGFWDIPILTLLGSGRPREKQNFLRFEELRNIHNKYIYG